ncbi:MAG: hypothetical protein ACOYL6_15360 [Bacteriovoracaceae bacterium]
MKTTLLMIVTFIGLSISPVKAADVTITCDLSTETKSRILGDSSRVTFSLSQNGVRAPNGYVTAFQEPNQSWIDFIDKKSQFGSIELYDRASKSFATIGVNLKDQLLSANMDWASQIRGIKIYQDKGQFLDTINGEYTVDLLSSCVWSE